MNAEHEPTIENPRIPSVVRFLAEVDARNGVDPALIAEKTKRVVAERRIARAVLEAEQSSTEVPIEESSGGPSTIGQPDIILSI